ncbi:MAG: PAS domain S-box protein [Gemmataceae bacterium]|nr:PAS domain S-box protein [Gemmataceae bacterium]
MTQLRQSRSDRISDVEKVQRLERALQASQARFRNLIANNADGMIVVSTEGMIRFMNPAAEALFGCKNDACVGVPFGIPITTLDRTEVELPRAAKPGAIAEMHVAETEWEGEPAYIASLRDVTERKRNEIALRESEQRLRHVTDALPGLVAYVDVEERYQFNNAAYDRFFGIPAQSLRGKLVREVLDAETYQSLAPHMKAAFAGSGVSFELDLRGVDGAIRHHIVTYVPHIDDTGTVLGFYVLAIDISDRKKAEQNLKDADKRKDEFLAMLAHELRNPLSPIRNSIHLMRLDPKRSAASDRALEIAERQVKNLCRLVDDLLDVSRITRGKIKLDKEPIDLHVVAARSVESVASLMEAHGHELSLSLGNRGVRVEGDATRLEQVICNLLNNAAKYTPNGGRIRLSVVHEGNEAIVRVTDNGVGIPAEILPTMFDLFAQDKRSVDRSQGGLGIGLTIARRLVEMHGGTLTAHSKGKDQGSEFVARLPALQAPALPHGSADGQLPGSAPDRIGRLRILLVEDQREAAEMLMAILQFWGHQVFVAYDGPTGLDAALKYKPEVVLMDIGLPGMSGLEVAQRLQSEPGFRNTLFIAITGYGDDDFRRQSREAGFTHHLVKPVNLATLESLLKEAKSAQSLAR